MEKYGLLIDNLYCTGCHSCEIACRNELDLPTGQWGIKILELGPFRLEDGKHWEYRYIPVPTSACTLCADRVAEGEKPSCVQHCLASVIEYGPLDSLAMLMARKEKMASIFIP